MNCKSNSLYYTVKKLAAAIVLLMTAVSFSYSQTTFKPGYIVDNNGDTIVGTIEYQNAKKLALGCKFKNAMGVVSDYSPQDLKAFRFDDGDYFVSKNHGQNRYFFQMLVEGKMSLYFLYDNGECYYIQKSDSQLVELISKVNIINENDIEYVNHTNNINGVLKYYMQDVSSIYPDINKITNLNKKSLVAIVKKYNDIICPDNQCVLYVNKLPMLRIDIEPMWGMIKYDGDDYYKNQFGLNAYLGFRTFDNFRFNSGLFYTNTMDETILRVPLQIQYKYQAYRLQPKISVGWDLFYLSKDDARVLILNSIHLGLNYKLNESLSISTSCGANYPQFLALLFSNESDDDSAFTFYNPAFQIGLNVKIQ